MEQWYLPITFLPAVGLMVISCTNMLIDLNDELDAMEHDGQDHQQILQLKFRQLNRLTVATVFFYAAATFFTLAGLLLALTDVLRFSLNTIGMVLLLIGVGCLIAALVLLVMYSLKAVSIRKKQHKAESS